MANLGELLRACVVQIVDRDGFRGSGFFVGPGLVLSCAHVVEGASGGLRVAWQGSELPVPDIRVFPAERGAGSHYPLPDLALLHVDAHREQGGVWLGGAPPVIGAELVGIGFSADAPGGTVAVDSILVTAVGPAGDGFVKIKGDRIPAGMSGSPLLDRVNGRVCGMLKASHDYATSEGGWIVPVDVIVGYLPEVAAVNARAHPVGGLWRDLATDRAGWTRQLFGEPDPTAAPDPPRDPRPSWWLEPRHQVVDFHPRHELELLRRWCQNGASGHWMRLVRAPGGAGKTRLGLQLCRRMQREGWVAGLLRSGASLDSLGGDALPGAIEAGHRVLVVIDYGETFAYDLPQVIASLVRCPAGSIRLLLLARNTGRWWDTLTEEANCGHLIDPAPLVLSNLGGENLGDRQAVLISAHRAFARAILGDQADNDNDIPADLLAVVDQHPTALSLHALVLNHVLDRQSPQRSPRENPLRGVVAHERRYWQRVASRAGVRFDPADRLADQILLVPTLYPARDFADAEATLARIPRVMDRFPGQVEDLAISLAEVYPNTNPEQDRYWDPLQPDRLGETLLAEVLADHPSDKRAIDFLQAMFADANIGQAVQGMTVLVRTSGDAVATKPVLSGLPHGSDTAGIRRAAQAISPLLTYHPAAFLPAAVTVAATIRTPAQLLSQLDPALSAADAPTLEAAAHRLPSFSLDFTQLAVSVTELLVDRLRQQHHATADVTPELSARQLASALNNLGVRLNAVGRREEALALTQEAVELYRWLAQTDPSAYLPDLAMSLTNLGVRLNAGGRRREALMSTEEAVGLYRRLAPTNPAVYLPHLAMSLNNLGNRLNAVGRREEALAPAEEAVTIRRQLAQVDSSAYLPDLATSLTNLGIRLDAVDRPAEALAATEEAVTIRRQLAQADPAAYLPDLAISLTNLGSQLDAAGWRTDAVAATDEAVKYYRRLAQTNPAAYLPDLAAALINAGIQRDAVARRAEALAAIEEAVELYRQLTQTNPDTHLLNLAMSLYNLGIQLDKVGRRAQAIAPTEEAIELYRRLAQTNSAHLPNLAASLNNLGIQLDKVGRRAQAIAPTEEAVKLYRKLTQTNSAHLPNLATALNNLCVQLDKVGRHEEAEAAWTELARLNAGRI